MALKKSQLYSSLWQSCDELRGGMDASQYKDYVLTLLFMKYVSDKYAGKPNALIEVPKGGSFADMVVLGGDKEIGDKINKIIGKLAEKNDLKGVIDQADFNDESKLGAGKDMQDKLSKLVAIFDGLDFRANRAEGDDLLGDAYEYLMRHFATESGKSKGQFYTPAEVSRIMAQVIGLDKAAEMEEPTVYDPTCGSGSLLIKAADQAAISNLAVYGQEMDVATWALARMNMILHNHPTAEIWRGNTLAAPHFKNKDGSLKAFDFAVANPPFSAKAWSSGLDPAHDEFARFELGVPPGKNGDFAFLLHLITSLKSKGKGAIILPRGALLRSKKEGDIRRNLVRRGLIKGIIGLPANLFYGTGIPACILVIDKEDAHARTGIFMIDASKGFLKDGNKNRLRAQDIHRIVDVFSRQIELPRYSRMVPVAEISAPANDYNLNISRYIDSSEPEDLHDLDAHLNGGVPNRDIDALRDYWEVFPLVREALFKSSGRAGYSDPVLEAGRVKKAILVHPQFKAFAKRVIEVFDVWRKTHESTLKAIKVNDLPKTLIHNLSKDILARFTDLPLLDRYDIYQRLMDYWADVMQDDVYLIAADGWVEAARPRGIIEDKERKIRETPDLVIKRKKYKMDLVPPALVASRWFRGEQALIKALQARQEVAAGDLEEFVEEHAGEEGLLGEALNDKGRITKGGAQDRLNTIENESDSQEEIDALTRCLSLMKAESEASKATSDTQAALDEKVLGRYAEMTEAEIKTLVVEDKWLGAISDAITSEVALEAQELVSRISELETRYANALPRISASVADTATWVEKVVTEHSAQQLLTGQARLSGFTKTWRPAKLRDLLCYERPDRYIVRSTDYVDRGDVPVLTANKSFVLGYTTEEFGIYTDLPAIIFDDFTTDLKYVDFPFKIKSSAIKILTPRIEGVNLGFMFARMQLIRHSVGDHKRYYISEFQNLEILLPEEDEQEAIAILLAQVEGQVVNLERLRDKTRWIQRGIAQALCLGRQGAEPRLP